VVTFETGVKETDLWIAVDTSSYRREIEPAVRDELLKLRFELEEYISEDPEFAKTLKPYLVRKGAPRAAVEMAAAAAVAGVGPMATVAGLFAQRIGKKIREMTDCRKLIVENGGDIFLFAREQVTLSIYAGNSLLSEKIGLRLKPEGCLGICTSSGTVGHSLSFGRADAVVVICEDVLLADAYATAFCNMVKGEDDIAKVLEKAEESNAVRGAVIILDKYMGAWGELELTGTVHI